MDMRTAEILCELNTRFYAENAESFSETRVAPWPGWRRCLELTAGKPDSFAPSTLPGPVKVFDLACGNLRFESFLMQTLQGQADQADKEGQPPALDVFAVDNCQALLPEDLQPFVSFRNLDVVQTLLNGEGEALAQHYRAPLADLSVCFGFMHHVPTERLRQQVLQSLVCQTKPGGFVCVSLWAFMNNDQLAVKAQETHAQGLTSLDALGLEADALEENDYLLGWKNTPGVYRYCHHFAQEEVEALAASVADHADVAAQFLADGRTGNMNWYLVLKVR